ncbi:hypothetical protein H6CHR_03190 [Variovorax sp. PBL-H6]|nr:hypothetical protein H6CHR_03190 [Variovorax sp. PBL-H6]
MTKEQVATQGTLQPSKTPNVYIANNLRSGHPDFDDYRFLITPVSGLCRVQAWKSNISTSAYGDGLLSEFEAIQSAITLKYGAGKKFDYLQHKSIWNEPRDFMMGLKAEERTLAVMWANPSASDGLEAISLKALAASPNTGMILLTYEFKNFEACAQEQKAKRSANL